MKKIKTRQELIKTHESLYRRLLKVSPEWLDKHLPKYLWDKNACIKEAKKYKTRSEWQKKSESSYQKAYIKGWLDTCCKHMKKVHNNWTLQKCKNSAKKYLTVKEWSENDFNAYTAAKRRGFYKKCIKHMKKGFKTRLVKNLCTNKLFSSISDAAKSVKVTTGSMCSSIKNGYKAGGYRWAYCDKNGKLIK